MKIVTFKNGASVIMDDPSFPSGMVKVICRKPSGDIHDRVSCDTASQAREYFKAFKAIAKNF